MPNASSEGRQPAWKRAVPRQRASVELTRIFAPGEEGRPSAQHGSGEGVNNEA
jgi:hypothetical protein